MPCGTHNSLNVLNMKFSDNTFAAFNFHTKLWKVCAMYPIKYRSESQRRLHKTVAIFVHFFLSIIYPLTLLIKIFEQENVKGALETLAMAFTMALVTIKGFFLYINMDKFVKMDEVTSRLQGKLMSTEFGAKRHQKVEKELTTVFKVYAYYYSLVVVTAGLAILTWKEKRLQYPAYYPFDWKSSDLVYVLVLCYQYFGWAIAVMYTFTLDTYPGFLISLLKLDVDILANRVSCIGYSGEPDPHKLLKEAIEDHKMLNEFFDLLNQTICFGMFFMFIMDAVSTVSNVLILVYFCDNLAETFHFTVIFLGHLLQIIFSCYYGSQYTTSHDYFKSAIYGCNWMDQSRYFKRDLIIFVENCIRSKEFLAGGIIPVSLGTFAGYLKTSYSTYTVLNHMSSSNN